MAKEEKPNKQAPKQNTVTIELTPVGLAFLQVCVATAAAGRFTPQGTPEALQIWLNGYQEVRAQLPANGQVDEK